jgi:hypothetical protein
MIGTNSCQTSGYPTLVTSMEIFPAVKVMRIIYLYTKEEVEADFDRAWLRHLHRNKHHPQHWVLIEDSGAIVCLPMPYIYILEMIAD